MMLSARLFQLQCPPCLPPLCIAGPGGKGPAAPAAKQLQSDWKVVLGEAAVDIQVRMNIAGGRSPADGVGNRQPAILTQKMAFDFWGVRATLPTSCQLAKLRQSVPFLCTGGPRDRPPAGL